MLKSVVMVVIFAAASTALNATAQTTTPPDPATFCGGKYEAAEAIIEGATRDKGTLYSGGIHWRHLEHVDGTVQAYRLLTGRKASTPMEQAYVHNGKRLDIKTRTTIAEPRLREALRQMTEPDIIPDVEAAVTLDLATSIGPSDNWWREAERHDDLTQTQAIVAEVARKEPALDWLQAALIVSRQPHNIQPIAPLSLTPAGARLREDVLTREEPEWRALAIAFHDLTMPLEPGLARWSDDVVARVGDCEASPSDYAALIAGGRLFDGVPLSADLHHRQASAELKSGLRPGKRGETLNYQSRDPRDLLEVVGSWEAAILYGKKPRTEDFAKPRDLFILLDALSGSDFADGLDEVLGVEDGFVAQRLARAVAFGNTARALELRDEFLRIYPNRADTMDGLEMLPKRAQLAMFVLRDRCISLRHHFALSSCSQDPTGIMPVHLDYGVGWSRERILAAHLDMWRNSGVGDLHARNMHRLDRRRPLVSYRNDGIVQLHDYHFGPRVFPPDGPYYGYIPRDDLARTRALEGDSRLSRRLAVDIVSWVEAGTRTRRQRWRNRHEDIMAEALSLVVAMGRHDDPGDIDGRPAQQRAFQLLHRRFPESRWADATPIWKQTSEHARRP